MLRTILWCCVLGGVALGAEANPDAKAERIKTLTTEITRWENTLASLTDERIAKDEKAGRVKLAEGWRKERKRLQKVLPEMRLELQWLKGEVTLAGCKKQVAELEAALEKAKDQDKPPVQAALEDARKQLEAVQKLEESRDF